MNVGLARDYFARAEGRREVVELLANRGFHADAVREAQELVELVLKGFLRQQGIDPPRIHDVGPALLQYADVLPDALKARVPRLAEISKALRKEREMSFYGDDDFVPSDSYGPAESTAALSQVDEVLSAMREVRDGS